MQGKEQERGDPSGYAFGVKCSATVSGWRHSHARKGPTRGRINIWNWYYPVVKNSHTERAVYFLKYTALSSPCYLNDIALAGVPSFCRRARLWARKTRVGNIAGGFRLGTTKTASRSTNTSARAPSKSSRSEKRRWCPEYMTTGTWATSFRGRRSARQPSSRCRPG